MNIRTSCYPAYRNALVSLLLFRMNAALPRDPARRLECSENALLFCQTYFPFLDWDSKFCREYVSELEEAVLVRGSLEYRKAMAAPRGIGKTTIALIVMLWGCLYGHIEFGAILSSSSSEAEERLDTIKSWICSNEYLYDDFPEICGPIREISGDGRRAKSRGFTWDSEQVMLPNGVWLKAGGLKGPVKGMNKRGLRPDFVLMDDLEDEESIGSEKIMKKLENRIINEVLGIGRRGARTVFLYLCTIPAPVSISARYTDPEMEPEWRGRRYKALIREPEDSDAWLKYMEIVRGETPGPIAEDAGRWVSVGRSGGSAWVGCDDETIADEFGISRAAYRLYTPQQRAAMRFYFSDRDSMDLGAELLDERRRPLHDLYHERATKGEHYWACEIQQDPPREESTNERRLTVAVLRGRIDEPGEGLAPPWARYEIATVDVGQYRLHWEIDAWDASLNTSRVALVGQQRVTDIVALELADNRRNHVAAAIRAALDELRGGPFTRGLVVAHTGEILKPRIIMVDCGGATKTEQAKTWAWYEEILKICMSFGSRWFPLRGAEWHVGVAARAMGRNWKMDEKDNPAHRIEGNANYYKKRMLDAYELPLLDSKGGPYVGSRSLYAGIPSAYLRHQTAEKLRERVLEGKPIERAFALEWLPCGKNEGGYSQNHWLDTGWMQFCGADLLRFFNAQQRGAHRQAQIPDASRNKIRRRY